MGQVFTLGRIVGKMRKMKNKGFRRTKYILMLMEMPAQNVEQWLQTLTAVEQFGRGRLSKETVTMRLKKPPSAQGSWTCWYGIKPTQSVSVTSSRLPSSLNMFIKESLRAERRNEHNKTITENEFVTSEDKGWGVCTKTRNAHVDKKGKKVHFWIFFFITVGGDFHFFHDLQPCLNGEDTTTVASGN